MRSSACPLSAFIRWQVEGRLRQLPPHIQFHTVYATTGSPLPMCTAQDQDDGWSYPATRSCDGWIPPSSILTHGPWTVDHGPANSRCQAYRISTWPHAIFSFPSPTHPHKQLLNTVLSDLGGLLSFNLPCFYVRLASQADLVERVSNFTHSHLDGYTLFRLAHLLYNF
jgi:hypothetical protein